MTRTLVSLFGFTEEQQRRIGEAAPGWRVVFAKPGAIDPALYREAEVLCGWAPAAAEALADGSRLRWIQAGSAGVDTLPLDELERRGVALTDASGIHRYIMTETVFALLLGLSRQVHRAVRNQQLARWERPGSFAELRGQTIGIVGAGAIGVETARIAQAFGMRTLGVRRSGRPAPHIDEMYPLAELDRVLAASDYVVNILPSTDETRHLFDEARFSSMKPGSLFINVGRGATVRTEALIAALRDGPLAGAGLDVFEEEPLPADHPLWRMDNVILTPHIGGMTDQYKERMTELFVRNLEAYMATGAPVENLVSYALRY